MSIFKKMGMLVASLVLALSTLTIGAGPAQAYCAGGSCSQIYYASSAGPSTMPVHCILNNGTGATINVAQVSGSDQYGCQYVYQVYVPAGYDIWCATSIFGTKTLKWSATGWNDWPGTNKLYCAYR